MELSIQRPAFVGPEWLRPTTGFRFAAAPPPELAGDRYLSSQNLWERIVCVTLQAMVGDFRNTSCLVETAHLTKDPYVGAAAVRVFCHSSPTNQLPKLAGLFEHPDYDVRLESYTGSFLTCSLSLVEPLLAAFPSRVGDERNFVATALWDLLDPLRDGDDALIEKIDDTGLFIDSARTMAKALSEKLGPWTAVLHGASLSMLNLVQTIGEHCRREDRIDMGGEISDLIAIFEASTGIISDGCFTQDVSPSVPRISSVLNQFMTSGRANRWIPGRRYFFGHPLDQ